MKQNNATSGSIGSRIKDARDELGLSQADLAKKLGFQSSTAISLIENGERGVSSEMLKGLTEVLKHDVSYFLGYGKTMPAVDVQVALRADPGISKDDKEAIARFIELAKQKKNGNGST